jgi:Transcriptional regulator, AbiEi antitoxin
MPVRPLPESTVFTRADARALGWTDSALSRAVRSGRLTRLRHGRLTARAEVGVRELGMAAVDACAGSVLSHRSALIVHGLPMLGPLPARPELTVAPRRIGRLADVDLHRATLWADDVVMTEDGPTTSPARTLIDSARHLSTAASVVAMDAALHRRLVRVADLEQVLVRCWNWPGIARASRAVDLADGRAESPLESVSRLVIRWLRLPVPDLQAVILDEDGRVVGRLDFYWDEPGVGGEADGRLKYTDRDVLTAEKDRQERLEDLAVVMTRWGWAHTTRPAAIRTKIDSAFRRGRARDGSGLQRGWSVRPTPRDHFA